MRNSCVQGEGKTSVRRGWLCVLALVGLMGTLALYGCSGGTEEDSAPEPQPQEQKVEKPAEPEVKTEKVTYPFDVVKPVGGESSADPYYDYPTQCLEKMNVKDISITSDGVCTAEAPEGTGEKLKEEVAAYLTDVITGLTADYQEWDGSTYVQKSAAPLACEVAKDCESITLSVEVPGTDNAGNLQGGGAALAMNAMMYAGQYRTFAGLNPTVHLLLTDGEGAVLIDQDFDTSTEDYLQAISAVFSPSLAGN